MSRSQGNNTHFRPTGNESVDGTAETSTGMSSHPLRARLAGAAAFSFGLSLLLLITASGDESPLGVPRYWPWLLTALQVLALWSAGTDRWWGWLLGGSIQTPWIAYAIETSQLGFIPGCIISAIVQFYSFHRIAVRTPTATEPHSVAAETGRTTPYGGAHTEPGRSWAISVAARRRLHDAVNGIWHPLPKSRGASLALLKSADGKVYFDGS